MSLVEGKFLICWANFFHSIHNSDSLVNRPSCWMMNSIVPQITRRLSRIDHSVLSLMRRTCRTWHIMPSTFQGPPPSDYTGHFEYAYSRNLMVGINHFELNAAFDSHLPSLLWQKIKVIVPSFLVTKAILVNLPLTWYWRFSFYCLWKNWPIIVDQELQQ